MKAITGHERTDRAGRAILAAIWIAAVCCQCSPGADMPPLVITRSDHDSAASAPPGVTLIAEPEASPAALLTIPQVKIEIVPLEAEQAAVDEAGIGRSNGEDASGDGNLAESLRELCWVAYAQDRSPKLAASQACPRKQPDLSDDALLDQIQQRAVLYFWQQADPMTGLVKDRANNFGAEDYMVASIAATGFGLAGLAIGESHGWLTYDEAYERTLATLRYLRDDMPQEHGFYYHFVDASTGQRVWESEVSSIDTAWLLAGVLMAGEYFKGTEVEAIADELYGRVDFPWMLTDGGSRPDELLLSHGWTPENGFLLNRWDSYNELMLLYLLAIGSPTHPIPAKSWEAWSRPEGAYGGYETFAIGPLFTHQFSQAWVNFRSRTDRLGYDYWQSSVNATLANRQFCIDNQEGFQTYDEDVWGLTASDGPEGYRAYGALPGAAVHDGTVSPAASGGSIVFTPEWSLAALQTMYKHFGDRIWGRYGFSDAFNVDRDWWDQDVIGIDLGITLLMIENYHSALVWRSFQRNEHVEAALDALDLELQG